MQNLRNLTIIVIYNAHNTIKEKTFVILQSDESHIKKTN